MESLLSGSSFPELRYWLFINSDHLLAKTCIIIVLNAIILWVGYSWQDGRGFYIRWFINIIFIIIAAILVLIARIILRYRIPLLFRMIIIRLSFILILEIIVIFLALFLLILCILWLNLGLRLIATYTCHTTEHLLMVLYISFLLDKGSFLWYFIR